MAVNTDSENRMFAVDIKAPVPGTNKNKATKGLDNNYNDYIDTTNIQINKSARNKANHSKTN